ncbi:lysine--tRNA ligase [Candidatus Woesearchaeota archaeon]|nr:lysine--tRNA ligase [Candidatus Woesearchaeota archaeon]
MADEKIHWADLLADKIIKERGKKDQYVCASGITPSGTVHIGNFREIITVDLVVKALRDKGKKVRFIYSWDDYDRFRKVPKNMPKQDLLKKYIGIPVVDTPDVFGCHKSYADHLEKELEESLPAVNIKPEFIYQHKMYRACKYAKEIKYVLNNKEKIREILNKYKDKELLPGDWWPAGIYCEKCKTDNTKILDYDNEYKLSYECDCGFSNEIDFRKKGIVKLSWRVDWPMRQHIEKVDFEPAGKEHYQHPGGSRITSNETYAVLYNDMKHPIDLKYDFVILKGIGGKISSSLGNVITLNDCLEVYQPEIVRFLFAGTRPNTEFAISFDLDVVKIYEDFDRLEEKYYNDDKIDERDKRIYELSCIKIESKKPERIGFRHMTMLVQIYDDLKKISKDKKILERAQCARNWIEKYAPEEFKFKIHEKISKEILKLLDKKQKDSLKLLKEILEKKRFDEKSLFNEFYEICKTTEISNVDFFRGAYLALIGKEKGPRLASFILAIGKEKVVKLLKEAK